MYFNLNFSSQLVLLALGEVESPPHRRIGPVDAREAVAPVHEGEVEEEAGGHEQDDVQELDLRCNVMLS